MSPKLIFSGFIVILFGIAPLFVRNKKRFILFLASSLYVFSSAWIFYRYNGIMLADIPIFILLAMAIASRRRVRWIHWPIGLPLLLFILWSVFVSFNAFQSGWSVSEMTKFLRIYLLIVGLAHHVETMSDLKTVGLGMLTGLLLEGLLGVYQWRFGALGLWFLGEREAAYLTWRSSGTFFVPSFYANYLAMMIPLAFRMFIFYKPPQKKWVWFYGAAFFTGVMALFATYGRGPWIGLSIALALTSLWSFFKRRFKSRIRYTIPLMLVFAVLFAVRYGDKVLLQFGEQRQVSADVRFPQFRIASRIIMKNPAVGVGLGNYIINTWNYMTEDELNDTHAVSYALMVHNVYLLISAETGIPGGVFLAWWLISILVTAVKLLRSTVINSYIVNITMGILSGALAIIIVFTFSPDIHAYQLLYQLGLFCGTLLAMRNLIEKARRRRLWESRRRKSVSGRAVSAFGERHGAISSGERQEGLRLLN